MAGDEYFKHMIGRVIYRTAVTDFIITLILRPVLELRIWRGLGEAERAMATESAMPAHEAVSAGLKSARNNATVRHHRCLTEVPITLSGAELFESRGIACGWREVARR